MDGLQKRLKHSLQVRLSAMLSLVIVLVGLLTGFLAFRASFHEAVELQDDVLKQMSTLFERPQPVSPNVLGTAHLRFAERDAKLLIQWLDAPLAGNTSTPRVVVPPATKDGFHTLDLDGHHWRVLVRTLENGQRLAVGQRTSARDEIARDSGIQSLFALFILVPVLMLVVCVLIRRMLRPVMTLAAELDKRTEDDLRPLSDHDVPLEIRPFTASINRLLHRVVQSIDMQRRFVADAAHELRSPLTALSLQIESLKQVTNPQDSQQRLETVWQGMRRTRAMLDQLLTLARSQTHARQENRPVLLQRVFRSALEDIMPQAEARQVDVEVVAEEGLAVMAQEVDLIVLLRNLLDNAVRYNTEQGRVGILAEQHGQHVVLQVVDTGPGIPLEALEEVMNPFFRVLGTEASGSGLGLSIVKTIVERLGGTVSLANRPESDGVTGLVVKVVLPAASE